MKRTLLDENIPIKLLDLAPVSCETRHVLGLGWAHMPDAELLDHAHAAQFDVFVTADQSIAHQQNWRLRRVALVVLTTNNWHVIRDHAPRIYNSAARVSAEAVEIVTLPRPVVSGRR